MLRPGTPKSIEKKLGLLSSTGISTDPLLRQDRAATKAVRSRGDVTLAGLIEVCSVVDR
jgi:hypothetical protein